MVKWWGRENFRVAASRQPESENLRWVKALYSPLVAQSIQEMQVSENVGDKPRLSKGCKTAAPQFCSENVL